jgi:biotin synthase
MLSGKDFQRQLAFRGDEQKDLFQKADAVRREAIGDKVHFRGIIEFSNICEKNCYYCGIRRDNRKTERFRMSLEEIADCLKFIDRAGYQNVVLQSGELTNPQAVDFVISILRLIKKQYPDWGITLSLGELSCHDLKRMREEGGARYLLRIESSTPEFYKTMHPADHSHARRLQTLKDLKELGYQVGTGVIIGLPGQTAEHVYQDFQFLTDPGNGFHMFGIGPYVMHGDTPLATEENKRWWNATKREILENTLNFLAMLRIALPKANIATATALDAIHPLGRHRALQAGANIFMPSVTPGEYRKMYLLYQNKPCVDEGAGDCLDCSVARVRRAGLIPGLREKGDSQLYSAKNG